MAPKSKMTPKATKDSTPLRRSPLKRKASEEEVVPAKKSKNKEISSNLEGEAVKKSKNKTLSVKEVGASSTTKKGKEKKNNCRTVNIVGEKKIIPEGKTFNPFRYSLSKPIELITSHRQYMTEEMKEEIGNTPFSKLFDSMAEGFILRENYNTRPISAILDILCRYKKSTKKFVIGSSSSTDCDSSRPSSVADLEDEFKKIKNLTYPCPQIQNQNQNENQFQNQNQQVKKPKYFSLSRFSSVFKKDQTKNRDQENLITTDQSSIKKTNSSSSSAAKEVIRKYLKKVKPLYEKLSHKQQQQQQKIGIGKSKEVSGSLFRMSSSSNTEIIIPNPKMKEKMNVGGFSNSFSGNLRYPGKKSCISSCPSSIRTSPNHSGVLNRNKIINGGGGGGRGVYDSETSSMNELQNAIQGAIAHCKNSMIQKEPLLVSK